jgi:predicted transcriptional regulator YdeE
MFFIAKAAQYGKARIFGVIGIGQAAQTHAEDAAAVVADLLLVDACGAESGRGHGSYFRRSISELMKIVPLGDFAVVGIEGRTSFTREKMPGGLIPELWGRFMKEGLPAAIPNRCGGDIVALYTDYESDEYGEYTLVIGARVSSVAEVPAGMVAKRVAASKYAVFDSDRGPVARIVIDTWRRIWNEPRTAEYARSYRFDFEVYGAGAADPADSRVQIYVGVT